MVWNVYKNIIDQIGNKHFTVKSFNCDKIRISLVLTILSNSNKLAPLVVFGEKLMCFEKRITRWNVLRKQLQLKSSVDWSCLLLLYLASFLWRQTGIMEQVCSYNQWYSVSVSSWRFFWCIVLRHLLFLTMQTMRCSMLQSVSYVIQASSCLCCRSVLRLSPFGIYILCQSLLSLA